MDRPVTYRAHRVHRSINVDAVLDGIADQVLNDGNVEKALQRAFRFGTEDDIGLLDILDRLRQEAHGADTTLQPADQHAGVLEMRLDEERRHDAAAAREALRQVESLNDLQGIEPELLERALTASELEWVEKWADMTGQLIESDLVVVVGGRLALTTKAIQRIGSQLLKHIFLPPRSTGRGTHRLHPSGKATINLEETIGWEWGRPFDLDVTRSLTNALRHQHSTATITLSPDDFEVYDRESGAGVATALLIDMSRSMFESGAWDAAKRAAIALNTLHTTSQPHDILVLIGFSGDARRLEIKELPSLSWDQFSHGTNLHAGLLAAGRELRRFHGTNRQIVIITDGEPTAFMDGNTPTFEHPVTDRTISSTLREARRLARRNVASTMVRVEDVKLTSAFGESFVRATSGRLIDVPLDSLGAFVVRDIARGTVRTIR